MKNITTVKELSGKFFVETKNGEIFELKIGDTIRENDIVFGSETNQAGSNMTRSSDGKTMNFTSGENGSGTACLTALANHLMVISKRPQEKKMLTVIYAEGKCIDEKLEDYDFWCIERPRMDWIDSDGMIMVEIIIDEKDSSQRLVTVKKLS